MSEMQRPEKLNRRGWLLILALIVCALLQLGALMAALTLSPELQAQISLIPALEPVAGVVWIGVFAYALARVWRTKRPRAGLITLAAFIAYSVLRLAVFARADYDRGRLPFLIVGGAVLIGVLLLAARPTRPQAD